VLSSATQLVEIIPGSSRTRFRDRPETVRLHRGIVFTFIPESFSDLPRNAVRNHPGTAFTFARIPQGYRYQMRSTARNHFDVISDIRVFRFRADPTPKTTPSGLCCVG